MDGQKERRFKQIALWGFEICPAYRFSMHSLLLIFNILAVGIGRQIFLLQRFDFVVSNSFAHANISGKCENMCIGNITEENRPDCHVAQPYSNLPN